MLEAFGQLGFRFTKADNERGRIHGVPQQLPFYQEIEFYPPPQFAGRVKQVELTFVTTPGELHVILEADKRAGLLRAGGDAYGRFAVVAPAGGRHGLDRHDQPVDEPGLRQSLVVIGTWVYRLPISSCGSCRVTG